MKHVPITGRNLMAGAARRVWEELYACKKPAIEEVFKVTLLLPVGNARAPDLTSVREQLLESAHKVWINYIDTERKVRSNQWFQGNGALFSNLYSYFTVEIDPVLIKLYINL